MLCMREITLLAALALFAFVPSVDATSRQPRPHFLPTAALPTMLRRCDQTIWDKKRHRSAGSARITAPDTELAKLTIASVSRVWTRRWMDWPTAHNALVSWLRLVEKSMLTTSTLGSSAPTKAPAIARQHLPASVMMALPAREPLALTIATTENLLAWEASSQQSGRTHYLGIRWACWMFLDAGFRT